MPKHDRIYNENKNSFTHLLQFFVKDSIKSYRANISIQKLKYPRYAKIRISDPQI